MLAIVAILAEADMDPEGFGGFGGLFFDQLVELEIVFHPLKPLVAGGGIWNVNVSCLTGHVLGVGGTSHIGMVVDLRTAVARAYDNWHVEVLTQGFKDVLAQGFEIGYDLSILGIVRVEAVVDAIL